MATKKEYKDFVLKQLSLLENVTYRPMMGEYLLYYNGTLFGGIYDDRLLVKITKNNKKYNMQKSIPYDGAKEMYLVAAIDKQEELKKIILNTYNDLISGKMNDDLKGRNYGQKNEKRRINSINKNS